MKDKICWHCGKSIPKNRGEAVWVWNKKKDTAELKVILHVSCFLKIGGII